MPAQTLALWLKEITQSAITDLFNLNNSPITIAEPPKGFSGDLTINLFQLAKPAQIAPQELGEKLGDYLIQQNIGIDSFQVIKGFLNLTFSHEFWRNWTHNFDPNQEIQALHSNGNNIRVLIEFPSPNTNKPLHLGHLRNIFLGEALSRMFELNGYSVIRANLVNDRGVHICKSMYAWMKLGNNETPYSTNIKGDHFVGKYYVKFEKLFQEEIAALIEKGLTKEQAAKEAPCQLALYQMLAKWEQGDPEIRKVWTTMNQWVYEGFETTFSRLGIHFDKTYYESNTYLLGKELIQEGLINNVFYQRPDNSIWVDLQAEKLEEKLVLRSDGTSVYITQDIGTARLKYLDFKMDRSVYVIGNEQEHQMKALFAILNKMQEPYAEGLYHLSYGMVELPTGKMKSREGTVVDADDLLDEMELIAENKTRELGKTEGLSELELNQLKKIIGEGALRYLILKVDPRKGMLFDPEESIDFKGNTGPFLQYTYARIFSLLQKATINAESNSLNQEIIIGDAERLLLRQLAGFQDALKVQTDKEYDPGRVANYAFELASRFGRFYNEVPVLKSNNTSELNFRIQLCQHTAQILKICLSVLGIEVPERM
jgi:arginyl-tRNA synthetase